MKKKIIVIVSIVIIVIIGLIIGFALYNNYKTNQENKAQERYAEIRESVEKAVNWNVKAMYPGCSISKELKENMSPHSYYNSNFLINNGYIKKSELLDIDNKSYCDIYVKINTYFENPLDHQHNCEVYYKIYLKCKDYEDKGYIYWG